MHRRLRRTLWILLNLALERDQLCELDWLPLKRPNEPMKVSKQKKVLGLSIIGFGAIMLAHALRGWLPSLLARALLATLVGALVVMLFDKVIETKDSDP